MKVQLPKTHVALALLCLLVPQDVGASQLPSCRPDDFGAAGDGIRLDSEAVLRAVRSCRAGGVVQFTAQRTYRLGEITITGTGIQVEVPPGTTLLASPERAHYGARQSSWYLLHFHRCGGCGLRGGGVIQGPARHFVDNSTTPSTIQNWRDASCRVRRQCRPRLVGVCDSRDVVVADLTLRDSALWTLHIRDSERVHVRGVTVLGDADFPNNDGIDIDGSSHVIVLQSYISTADDAVCVKATSGGVRAVRHVLVSNCTLQSRSAAVKLGSETRANMSDITFSHLQVLESNRGLAVQLRDHGSVRDVAFSDVRLATRRFPGRWWGGGEPLYVTAQPRWLGAGVGSVSNVTFTSVTAEVRGGAVVLAGSPEGHVRGMTLRNVRITLAPLSWEEEEEGGVAAAATAPPPSFARLRGNPGVADSVWVFQEGRDGGTGTAAGATAAKGLRLPIKLDLRPGPYGVRRWLATAPLLAQFARGLALQNVSFEVQAGPATAEAAVAASGDLGGGSDGSWFEEVVPFTVEVVMAEQVQMRVVAAIGPVGDGPPDADGWRRNLKPQSHKLPQQGQRVELFGDAMRRWRPAGGSGDLVTLALCTCGAAALVAAATAALARAAACLRSGLRRRLRQAGLT